MAGGFDGCSTRSSGMNWSRIRMMTIQPAALLILLFILIVAIENSESYGVVTRLTEFVIHYGKQVFLAGSLVQHSPERVHACINTIKKTSYR